VDPVQVPDRPIELLEGVLRRLPVAVNLLLFAFAAALLFAVLCH
jgi:hypothetical protein